VEPAQHPYGGWKKKITKKNTFDMTSFFLLSYHVLSLWNKRKSKSVFFKPDFRVEDCERYELKQNRSFSLINKDIEGGKLSLEVSKKGRLHVRKMTRLIARLVTCRISSIRLYWLPINQKIDELKGKNLECIECIAP
jgi:hypothetical protein